MEYNTSLRPTEEKLAMFERALYQTVQKPDESNDSYLARHNAAFEDLASEKMSLNDIRGYVLLRQFQVPAEDRKRIGVETQGELSYEFSRKPLRLLGAKFFQELQHPGKTSKYKTYDLNVAEHGDEMAMLTTEPSEKWDDDTIIQAFLAEGDEDAAFIADFEESLIDAVQEALEFASCYTTYLEARTRLKERDKYRGFWQVSSGGKGKGKKGKGAKGKGKPKSLAERIATLACKKCNQIGHWKWECPLWNQSNGAKTELKGKDGAEMISIAEALMIELERTAIQDGGIVPGFPDEIPDDAVDLGPSSVTKENSDATGVCYDPGEFCFLGILDGNQPKRSQKSPINPKSLLTQKGVFHDKLKTALSSCCRKCVIDTGAIRTVIGEIGLMILI